MNPPSTMSNPSTAISEGKPKSLIAKLPIGCRHVARRCFAEPAMSAEAQSSLSVGHILNPSPAHIANASQGISTSARRRSTRITASASSQSTIHNIDTPLPQADAFPQWSLLKLLSHLPTDFTTNDIHACEDTVLAAGGYVYLDIVVPYYQDAEARKLGTTKGELDAISALLELQFGKEAGKAKFDLGMEQLRDEATAAGRS